jgi:hypothetical protein
MLLREEFGISLSDDTIYRALEDLGLSHLSARPQAYKIPRPWRHLEKLHTWQKSQRSSRQAHRQKCGSRTKCGSGRRTSSHTAGLGRAHVLAPRTISAPSRLTCWVQFAPTAALVRAACNSEAMQLHLEEITTKVVPGAHAILLDQAGRHGARECRFRPTFPYCRCRRAHPSSTAKRTHCSSCVRTGCQTGPSNLLTTSSITGATPGTQDHASRTCATVGHSS